MKDSSMDVRYWILVAIFPVCSFAGLAALLRSNQPLTKRAIASAVLNSGLLGVAVAGLLIHHFGATSLHVVIAVSLLAGLGGNTAVDFMISALQSWVRKHDV